MNNVIQLFPNKSKQSFSQENTAIDYSDYLEEMEKLDTKRRIIATEGLAEETWFVPWVPSIFGALIFGWRGWCVGFTMGYIFRAFLLSTMRYGREL